MREEEGKGQERGGEGRERVHPLKKKEKSAPMTFSYNFN